MRIIPAIDIIDGKCVRLTQGDYAQKKIYKDNPLDAAKEFEDAGLKSLHLVDLDGAKAGQVVNWKVVEAICSGTSLNVDFGGGIKKREEVVKLFDLGIRQVNIGSLAVKNAPLLHEWIAEFGGHKIILSADVKNGFIAIAGWQENAQINLFDFIEQHTAKGILHITCTDVSTDGTLKGPNIDLYKEIVARFPSVKLVASGGIGSAEHIKQLRQTNVDGVIVGKAIYEGKIQLTELTKLNDE